MLQNELAKRENERKTSMNFGYGGGNFYTGQSPAMNPMMTSNMMPIQFVNGLGMQDDNNMGYFMGGPF